MENSNLNQPRSNGPQMSNKSGFKSESHVGEAASQLLEEGKKFANELYQENIAQKVTEAQETVKQYSDELTEKVKTNPLSALLIAGGIGFVLAKVLSIK
ncbi:hypothetical protein B1207_01610 [Legionella quinlivanii]|uniref:DUF883 domain-containing protein n=1 Tax=Legionella quinlivanii TaxID=45073 RepID=A0A364LNH3_9GAMM|nr:hypothetical protein [Legionella quinlivanii]RAP38601.1 hypothetical protein B1207_01610 [Legionella quinlivanii]